MKQYLHFRSSAGQRLISVDEIVEVIPMVELQREEGDVVNPKFCGLLNFRGTIVPVFDLSSFDENVCQSLTSFLIVTHVESRQLAIVALELDYLLDIEDEHINTIESDISRKFQVAKLGEEMVRIVESADFLVGPS